MTKISLSETVLLEARDRYFERDREDKEEAERSMYKLRRQASVQLARVYLMSGPSKFFGPEGPGPGADFEAMTFELSKEFYDEMSFLAGGDAYECFYEFGGATFVQRYDDNGPRAQVDCPKCGESIWSYPVRDWAYLGQVLNGGQVYHVDCPKSISDYAREKGKEEWLARAELILATGAGRIDELLTLIAMALINISVDGSGLQGRTSADRLKVVFVDDRSSQKEDEKI